MFSWIYTAILLCCALSVLKAASNSKLNLRVKSPDVQNRPLRVGDDVIITCQLVRPTTGDQHEVKSINLYILHHTGKVNLFSWTDGYVNAAVGSRWERSQIRVAHHAHTSMCYNGEVFCEVEDDHQVYSKQKPITVNENPSVSMNVDGECVTCEQSQSTIKVEADSDVTVSCQTEDFKQSHTVELVTEPPGLLEKSRGEKTPKNCAESVFKEAVLHLEPAQQVDVQCIVKNEQGSQLSSQSIHLETEAEPVVHLHMAGRCLTCKEKSMTLIESNILHRASCRATGFTSLLNVTMMLNNTLQAKVVQCHDSNTKATSDLMSAITMATGETRMLTCKAHGKDVVAERKIVVKAVSPEPMLYINSECISCKNPPEITIEKTGWDTKVKCRVPNLPSVSSLEIEGLPASPDELIHLEKTSRKLTHISRSARVRFDPDDEPYELFCNVTTTDGVIIQGGRAVVIDVEDQTGIDFLEKGNAMLLYLLIPSGFMVIGAGVYMVHRTFVQRRPTRQRRFSHRSTSISESPGRPLIRAPKDSKTDTEVRQRLKD